MEFIMAVFPQEQREADEAKQLQEQEEEVPKRQCSILASVRGSRRFSNGLGREVRHEGDRRVDNEFSQGYGKIHAFDTGDRGEGDACWRTSRDRGHSSSSGRGHSSDHSRGQAAQCNAGLRGTADERPQ